MQLNVTLGEAAVLEIKCWGCDSVLLTIREQDWRVHIMEHSPVVECGLAGKRFRVDRLSGYAEPWPEVKEKDSCTPSDETHTNTTTSVRTPCTTSRSVIRRTLRDTRGGVHGRIRLYREPE